MKSKKGLNSTQLRIILVAITNIIIITIIAVASILVYKNMLNKEEDKCWTLLEDSADSIEREINIQIQSNINILKLVSGAMVTEGRV